MFLYIITVVDGAGFSYFTKLSEDELIGKGVIGSLGSLYSQHGQVYQ